MSENSFEDVEFPVRVENRRCSHGFMEINCKFESLLVTGAISFENYQLFFGPLISFNAKEIKSFV